MMLGCGWFAQTKPHRLAPTEYTECPSVSEKVTQTISLSFAFLIINMIQSQGLNHVIEDMT